MGRETRVQDLWGVRVPEVFFCPFTFPPNQSLRLTSHKGFPPPLRRFVFPQKIPQKGIDLPGKVGERPGPTFQSWSSFQQDLGPLRKSWIKRSTERESFGVDRNALA